MARIVKLAASGELRKDHWQRNPSTGLYEQAALIEGQRQNGWAKSDAISAANGWVINNAGDGLTLGAAVAPDGSASMSALVESSASTGFHYIQRTLPATTDNTVQSASMTMKAGARTWGLVSTLSKDNVTRVSYVNLLTGAVGNQAAGHTIRVRDRGNGCYRLECSWDIGAGATQPRCYFGFTTGNGVASFPGVDGQVAGYLWRGTFEADAPFCSSEIPTDTLAVTRASDILTIPYAEPPQEGTFYARFFERGTVNLTGSLRVWQIGIGAGTNRLLLLSDGVRYLARMDNGAANTSRSAAASPVIDDLVEHAVRLYSDGSLDLVQSINGAAPVVAARSVAIGLPPQWDGTTGIGVGYGGTTSAFMAVQAIVPARGIHSLEAMRAFAGF